MYEKMMDDLKAQFQPAVEIAEINKKAFEALTGLQTECAKELTESSVEQMKALAACKDATSVVDLQIKFYNSFDSKLSTTAEKSVEVMTETRDALVAKFEEVAKTFAAEGEAVKVPVPAKPAKKTAAKAAA